MPFNDFKIINNNYMDYSLDYIRVIKYMGKNMWKIILTGILCAVGALISYKLYGIYQGGDYVSKISNDYYIYFDYEKFPEGPDFYNAFTWDSILRDDPVKNYCIEINSNITSEDIDKYVTGEMLGDYRILTVNVMGPDKKLVQEIGNAYKEALPNFANKSEMISQIELWTDRPIENYDRFTRDFNAMLLGAVCGIMGSTVVFLLLLILDERIYCERDWRKMSNSIPWLGLLDSEEYIANRDYIFGKDKKIVFLQLEDMKYNEDFFGNLRESGEVVLKIRTGRDKFSEIERLCFTLEKQEIRLGGVCGI